MHKNRNEAITLRKQGKTYSQISKVTGIRKSTLSYMLRDIPLTLEQKAEIAEISRANQQQFIARVKTKALNRRQNAKDLVAKSIPSEKDKKGQIAESAFEFIASERGLIVLRPLHPQLRYDRVIEVDGKWFKIQIKWGTVKDSGGYTVPLTKTRYRRDGSFTKKVYTAKDFDVLAVFNQQLRDFWLIPSEIATRRQSVMCWTEPPRSIHSDFNTSHYWKNWQLFGA